MIDIKEIYDEMLKQEQYLKEQGFNDEQIMIIEKLTANKEYLEKQLTKKDKQIDLMVDVLWDYDYLETYNGNIKDSKEQIKQYFEKEASKDEN